MYPNKENLTAPVVNFDAAAFREYVHSSLFVDNQLIDLHETAETAEQNRIGRLIAEHFSEQITYIRDRLEDPDCGICAVDMPELFDDPTDDAIAGALASVALNSALIQPVPDIENGTPFTMFTASAENSRALDALGMKHISPVDLLEFHSDGLTRGSELSVPSYISIYNTFIHYRRPGNFYWVPTSCLEHLESFVERIGFDDDFRFGLTPAVYGSPSGSTEPIVDRNAITSIFRKIDDGRIVTFMNGEFLGKASSDGHDYAEDVRAFKESIGRNRQRFFAPQCSRRMIFLNNVNGFHARDVFEEAIPGYPETRNYLRSVSYDAYRVGYIQ